MKLGSCIHLEEIWSPYVQFWFLTFFLCFTDFCRVFCVKVIFSETIMAGAMKLGSCIHLEELRSTLRSILILDLLFMVHWLLSSFLRLGHFLRNYNGWSHETWVMHTSWRVKVNPLFNFETWPTFYGSLTFVEFLRLGHFLRNYKG